MTKLTRELINIYEDLLEAVDNCESSPKNTKDVYKLLDIAVKIQYNRIMEDTHVIKNGYPSALESIAMSLSKTELV